MPTRAIRSFLLLSLAVCVAPSVAAQSPAAALDEVLSRHDGTATVRATMKELIDYSERFKGAGKAKVKDKPWWKIW
mgnify:CR=1 FL=1